MTLSIPASSLLRTRVPTASGRGQTMGRCPECYCVLWSEYGDEGRCLRVVRVGTIDGVKDEEGRNVPMGGLKPDAHIYARSRCAWIGVEGERVFEGMGKKEEYWSAESLERWRVFREAVERVSE
jgi:hypothetical protein